NSLPCEHASEFFCPSIQVIENELTVSIVCALAPIKLRFYRGLALVHDHFRGCNFEVAVSDVVEATTFGDDVFRNLLVVDAPPHIYVLAELVPRQLMFGNI